MNDIKSCSEKLKEASRQSSAEYWKAKAEEAGVKYIEGEAPQNLRMRIRDSKKEKENVEEKEEQLTIDEIRERLLAALALIDELDD